MLENMGLSESLSMIIYLMLSFAFFVGIMLLVSEESFRFFNTALEKEYGLKQRLIPGIENTQNKFIDFVILKYRMFSGLCIVIASFMLLLLYK